MKAVLRALFAAQRLGIGLGISLGKRSGLPLLGPERLLELAEGLRELTFEVDDASFELRDLAVTWIRCFPAVSAFDLRVSPEIRKRTANRPPGSPFQPRVSRAILSPQ
jgi:hypothetical protein